MTKPANPEPEQHGLVHSAIDLFLDRTRAVADLVVSAGTGAVGALPEPVPAAVTAMLTSMRQLLDQMPQLTAEVDILVQEVHAKRLSIQALQAELAALDNQLEVLERSFVPLQAWSRQWNRMRRSLTDSLPAADPPA